MQHKYMVKRRLKNERYTDSDCCIAGNLHGAFHHHCQRDESTAPGSNNHVLRSVLTPVNAGWADTRFDPTDMIPRRGIMSVSMLVKKPRSGWLEPGYPHVNVNSNASDCREQNITHSRIYAPSCRHRQLCKGKRSRQCAMSSSQSATGTATLKAYCAEIGRASCRERV